MRNANSFYQNVQFFFGFSVPFRQIADAELTFNFTITNRTTKQISHQTLISLFAT